MSLLEIRDLSLAYPAPDGTARRVLQHLFLTMEQGELFVLAGKSGSGKTSLLRCIGGFLAPDEGEILLNGKACTAPSAERMMVFQSFDQLFPWYTLRDNLLYALKKTKVRKEEREDIVKCALEDTGLLAFADSYPAALSGGMKQRAALARAFATGTKLLLLDEPFSSLDYLTRQSMYTLLQTLLQKNNSAALLVTHDLEEALVLGDRIGLLDEQNGRIGMTVSPRGEDPVHLKEKLIRALS